MGTKAQVGEERANGHRNINMNIEINLTQKAAKVPPKGGKSAHYCRVSAIAKFAALAEILRILQKRSCNQTFFHANTVSFTLQTQVA